jgi:hypothetical protein
MTTGVPVIEIALSRKMLLSLAVLLLSLTQTASAQSATKADLVLINGTILTPESQSSSAKKYPKAQAPGYFVDSLTR